MTMLLAGDIGGTKTNLAIYSAETGARKPLAEATFPSTLYPSLEALVRTFLSQTKLSVDRASFGVAGPVLAGHRSDDDAARHVTREQIRLSLDLSFQLVVS